MALWRRQESIRHQLWRRLWAYDLMTAHAQETLWCWTLRREDAILYVIDGVVTTVYRNYVLSKVATITEFAAKKVEVMKFKTDEDSANQVSVNHGGRHMLIPFAMEDGGRIGAHGQAALRMLAEYDVAKGKYDVAITEYDVAKGHQAARAAPLLPPEVVAMWVRRWQQKLSVMLHLTLSRQVMRYLAPFVVVGVSYS